MKKRFEKFIEKNRNKYSSGSSIRAVRKQIDQSADSDNDGEYKDG